MIMILEMSGKRRDAAEVVVISVVLVREWRAIGPRLSSTGLQWKVSLRGAVHGTGGAEIKIRPQAGEPTTFQCIKPGVREITVKEAVISRLLKGWTVMRRGGVGQLVNSIALLERKVELKSSFHCCAKKDKFITPLVPFPSISQLHYVKNTLVGE